MVAPIRQALLWGGTAMAVSRNESLQFPMSHALCFFRSRVIYTFIPKNACSTMRYSLAIANGWLPPGGNVEFIHQNNSTFVASLRDIATRDFAFVVLRHPVSRLISVFLDKFVDCRKPAVIWSKHHSRENLDSVCFLEFVDSLQDSQGLCLNQHWRPQTDFFLFDRYDAYYTTENFERCVAELRNLHGIEVHDARSSTNHAISCLRELDVADAFRLPVSELRRMKAEGWRPSRASMLEGGLGERIEAIYAADLLLHRQHASEQVDCSSA
jgi:hypothetical protein